MKEKILYRSNSLEVTKIASHAQLNLSKKIPKTDIVDINMGCPVNKIVKNEAGAMWLKDPDKIYSIINKVQSVLDIPLTVKMRTGWSDPSLAVENALAAEAAGVSACHARTDSGSKCIQGMRILRPFTRLHRP